jgi:hypothetical protein
MIFSFSGCLFSAPIEEHEDFNRSPEIDLTKITPAPFSHLTFTSSNPVDFKLEPDAVTDPDGDRICYLWIWDYDSGNSNDYSKVGKQGCSTIFSEYKVFPCVVQKALATTEKSHLLELIFADRDIIMDERIAAEGGFIQSIFWWVEFAEDMCEGL